MCSSCPWGRLLVSGGDWPRVWNSPGFSWLLQGLRETIWGYTGSKKALPYATERKITVMVRIGYTAEQPGNLSSVKQQSCFLAQSTYPSQVSKETSFIVVSDSIKPDWWRRLHVNICFYSHRSREKRTWWTVFWLLKLFKAYVSLASQSHGHACIQ